MSALGLADPVGGDQMDVIGMFQPEINHVREQRTNFIILAGAAQVFYRARALRKAGVPYTMLLRFIGFIVNCYCRVARDSRQRSRLVSS